MISFGISWLQLTSNMNRDPIRDISCLYSAMPKKKSDTELIREYMSTRKLQNLPKDPAINSTPNTSPNSTNLSYTPKFTDSTHKQPYTPDSFQDTNFTDGPNSGL